MSDDKSKVPLALGSVYVRVVPVPIDDNSNWAFLVLSVWSCNVVTLSVNVLFVNVSVPAKVANVPVVGNVTFVVPVVVNVNGFAPLVVNASANVTFFVAANVNTSVPPNVMELVASVVLSDTVNVLPSAIVNVDPVAGVVIVTLFIDVADATPKVGVVNVGDVANTNGPDPVSSDIAPDIPALVVTPVTGLVPLPNSNPVNVPAPVPPLDTDNWDSYVSVFTSDQYATPLVAPVPNARVPVALGILIVLSADGSTTVNNVSNVLAELPSNNIPVDPNNVLSADNELDANVDE